jgi:hypothetical protein
VDKQPCHIVVRIAMAAEPLEEIVERHNAVAVASNAVLFGVRGHAPLSNRTYPLIDQIKDNVPTFLYVVHIQHPTIRVYRAPLFIVSDSVSESDSALVPPYYAEFLQGEKIDLWLKTGPF